MNIRIGERQATNLQGGEACQRGPLKDVVRVGSSEVDPETALYILHEARGNAGAWEGDPECRDDWRGMIRLAEQIERKLNTERNAP